MAYITGTFKNNSANLKPYLYYSYTQDENSNTSTITLTLKIKKLSSYAQTNSGSVPYSISIDGNTIISNTTKFDCRKTAEGSFITIASKTKTLTHNNDGSLKIKISAVFDLTGFNPGKGIIDSTEIVLDTIPHQSTVLLNSDSFTIGENISGVIQSYSSDFYHKLVYNIDSVNKLTYDIPKGQTDFSYLIPLEWTSSELLKDSLSVDCIINLYTYSDSNYSKQIGKVYKTNCKLIVNTNSDIIKSYFSFDIGGISPIPNKYNNCFMKNKTKCRFDKIKISSTVNSTISYIRIVGSDGYDSGQIKYIDTDSFFYITSTITNGGIISYTFYAIDSKGFTVACPTPIQINVEEYTPPKINSVISSRVEYINNEFVNSDEGTSLKSVIDFDYFKIDNSIKELTITISKQGQTIDMETFSFSNNTFIDSNGKVYDGIKNSDRYYYILYIKTNLLIDSTYTITYSLTDSYETTIYIDELSSAYYILDISPNGKSIAIGKAADDTGNEDAYGLEVAMPLKITINNNKFEFNNSGFYLNGNKIKLIKENYNLIDTTPSIVLDKESCFYTFKNALSSLKISLSNDIFSNLYANNKINFSTSNSFNMNSDSNIYFSGVDCTNGVFSPQANSFYSIEFEYALNKILGKVFGISSKSSESGEEILPPSPKPEDYGPEPINNVQDIINLAKTYYQTAKNNQYFEYNQSTVLTYGLTSISSTQCQGETCSNNSYIGTTGPHYKANGTLRRHCDCSTFVGLVLRGRPFSTSRYTNWNTNDSEFDPVTYEWAFDFRDTKDISSSNGGIRTAAQIAEYLYNNGLMIDDYWTTSDYSKLKAGDIIFWDRGSSDNSSKWHGVSHVGICTGTEIIDEEEFKIKYPNEINNNTDITILECTNGKTYSGTQYGMRFVKLKDSYPNKVVHVARLQYKTIKTAIISNSSGNGCNVRTGPSSSTYESIGYLNNGTKIEIIDQTNGRSTVWYKIKYQTTNENYTGRKTGWVSSLMLSSIEAA